MMKRKICVIFIATICLILASCQAARDASSSETTAHPSLDDVMRTIDSFQATADPPASSIRVTETFKAEANHITYTFSIPPSSIPPFTDDFEYITIYGVSSKEEHVVIHGVIEGYPEIVNLSFGVTSTLSNARTIEIADGFQSVTWVENFGYMPRVETISIPATVTYIGTSIGYQDEHPSDEYLEKRQQLMGAFPTHVTSLQEIYVDPANTCFVSHNGILYEYAEQSTQLILMCVPQSYSAVNGTVAIQEETVALRYGAVYQCKEVSRLIIPDTVKQIADQAIIATEEHPLTVVCSRGSAAAEYVEDFGSLYHLTAEYTD